MRRFIFRGRDVTHHKIHRLYGVRVSRHAELGSCNFESVAQQLPPDAPLESFKVELRQVFAQPRRHLRQLYVCNDFRKLALVEDQPRTQCSRAVRKINREFKPAAPGRDIGVIELCKNLAVPLGEIAYARAREIAAHVERCSERFRRDRTQTKTMVSAVVLESEI